MSRHLVGWILGMTILSKVAWSRSCKSYSCWWARSLWASDHVQHASQRPNVDQHDQELSPVLVEMVSEWIFLAPTCSQQSPTSNKYIKCKYHTGNAILCGTKSGWHIRLLCSLILLLTSLNTLFKLTVTPGDCPLEGWSIRSLFGADTLESAAPDGLFCALGIFGTSN